MSPEWRELLSLIPGCDSEATAGEGDYFDAEAAERACSFFPEVLQLVEGTVQPFELQPWQAAIVAALWGWKDANGLRRFREAFIFCPRKNGKTPFAAGLMLLSALTDGEPGAQLYSAAPDKNGASLLFRHASEMILREPELQKRSKIYKSLKSIEFPNSTIFRALAADAHRLHGLNVSLAIIDELHQFPDSELVDVLITGTASRRQPLVVFITTSDFDRPSVCNSKHDYASKVRDGLIADRSFLPVIFEAGPDDDWTSPEVWAKANPNLGVSVSLEYLERECRRAQAEPAYESTFRRLHLNQKTSVETRWIRLEDWDACRRELPNLEGRECYAGLDLSTTTDICALSLVFPIDDLLAVLPFFWVPEAKLRDKRDRVSYDYFQRAGLVTVTSGNVTDYDRIRADIGALSERYNIQELRYDRWNASSLVTQLQDDGLTLTAMGQGYVSMAGPTREFERRVLGKTLIHDGNPVLRWMLGNVMVEQDAAGNIKPTKAKSTGRIDGVVATIDAISGAMTGDGPNGGSFILL